MSFAVVCGVSGGMADSGNMEAFPVDGASRIEELPPESEEKGSPILSKGVEIDSPKSRRSERKSSLRSAISRGRRAKSGPKSPMMRMAEMRKGGLRGRALRSSGKKGLEGSDLKTNKGKKGYGGRGLQFLTTISECGEDDG